MRTGASWDGGKVRKDGTRRIGWREWLGYVGGIVGPKPGMGEKTAGIPKNTFSYF
jgi:hypothetical protein